MIARIDGKRRGAPEESWVPGGGTEIPCIFFLYGVKLRKSSVRDKIKQYEKKLSVLKEKQKELTISRVPARNDEWSHNWEENVINGVIRS